MSLSTLLPASSVKIRLLPALKEDAEALLLESVDEKFESVIIFGFKDKKIFIKSSKNHSYLQVIGALEEAKVQLMKGAEYD